MTSDSSSLTKISLNEVKEILKEEFQSFKHRLLKDNIQLYTPKWDLLCFQYYNLLASQPEVQSRWEDFWEKKSKSMEYKGLVYKIPDIYKPFINNHSSLSKLFMLLDKKEDLGWEMYLELFLHLRKQIYPEFTKTEYELFTTIIKHQTSALTDLSNLCNKNKSNILRYLKSLKQKGLIYEGITINVSKLLLYPYVVLIQNPKGYREDFIDTFESLDSFRNFYFSFLGEKTLISFHIVNEKEKNLHLLEHELNLIKKKIYPEKVEIIELKRINRLKSFNYSLYNYKTTSWENPLVKFVEFHSGKTGDITEPIAEFSDDKPSLIQLNKSGIDILEYIIKYCDITQSRIQKHTQLSSTIVRKYIDYFKEQEVFTTRINPQPIFGLSNIIIILEENIQNQLDIHSRLSFLPEVYSEPYQSNESEGIVLILRLPQECVINFADLLSFMYKEKIKKIFLLESLYRRRRSLNFDYYDTLLKEWSK